MTFQNDFIPYIAAVIQNFISGALPMKDFLPAVITSQLASLFSFLIDKITDSVSTLDDQGNPVLDTDGKPETTQVVDFSKDGDVYKKVADILLEINQKGTVN